MSSGLTVSGFAGGTLDTASIVSQLMTIERQPLQNLQFRKTYLSTRQEAVRSINTKLLAAYTSANSLITGTSTIWSAMTYTSGDATKLTASVTTTAAAGTYSIDIDQLAKASTVAGDKQLDDARQIGSGKALRVAGQFTVTNGTQSAVITAVETDSLETLAGKINSAGIGVRASIVDNNLRIARTTTGDVQLNITDQFNVVTKTTSTTNASVVTGTVAADPARGTYTVTVAQLAAFRVTSDVQADSVTPLGKTGSFTVNGQNVDVAAGDNLATIASNVDGLVGVTAYVSTNRLIIESDDGTDLTASDTAGPNNVLQELGVLQGDNVTFKTIEANADSQFTVNGVSYTKNSNVLTGADSPVTGLDLTLTGTGTADVGVAGNGAVMQQIGFLDGAGSMKGDATHLLVAGQDSMIRVDGQVVQRSTNTIADAMTGVTLNLLAETTSAVQFDVKKDTGYLKEQITAFVEAYNAALDAVNSKLDERKVYNAKTDEDKLKGVLFNDSQLRRVKNTLLRYASEEITGLPDEYSGLASIGIATAQYVPGSGINTSGKLVIDEEKLAAALADDPDAVKEIFTHNSSVSPFAEASTGFAARVKSYVQPMTSFGGELSARTESIQYEIDNLDTRIAQMELRLEKVEDQYKRKFGMMEQLMAKMQAQSTWLSSYFAKSSVSSTSSSSSGSSSSMYSSGS